MEKNNFLNICKLLNKEGIHYIIVGGWAVVLHGYFRTTYGIEILVKKSRDNIEKLRKALKNLTWGIIEEISTEEILSKPFTIVGDQPRVDIITQAGKIDYDNIKNKVLTINIEGIKIPYIDIDTLIKMKNTGRLSDKEDIEKLKLIKKNIKVKN